MIYMQFNGLYCFLDKLQQIWLKLFNRGYKLERSSSNVVRCRLLWVQSKSGLTSDVGKQLGDQVQEKSTFDSLLSFAEEYFIPSESEFVFE